MKYIVYCRYFILSFLKKKKKRWYADSKVNMKYIPESNAEYQTLGAQMSFQKMDNK